MAAAPGSGLPMRFLRGRFCRRFCLAVPWRRIAGWADWRGWPRPAFSWRRRAAAAADTCQDRAAEEQARDASAVRRRKVCKAGNSSGWSGQFESFAVVVECSTGLAAQRVIVQTAFWSAKGHISRHEGIGKGQASKIRDWQKPYGRGVDRAWSGTGDESVGRQVPSASLHHQLAAHSRLAASRLESGRGPLLRVWRGHSPPGSAARYRGDRTESSLAANRARSAPVAALRTNVGWRFCPSGYASTLAGGKDFASRLIFSPLYSQASCLARPAAGRSLSLLLYRGGDSRGCTPARQQC